MVREEKVPNLYVWWFKPVEMIHRKSKSEERSDYTANKSGGNRGRRY